MLSHILQTRGKRNYLPNQYITAVFKPYLDCSMIRPDLPQKPRNVENGCKINLLFKIHIKEASCKVQFNRANLPLPLETVDTQHLSHLFQLSFLVKAELCFLCSKVQCNISREKQ